MKITIEIDEKELKGLMFGEEKPTTKVNYSKVIDYRSELAWKRLYSMLKDIADMYELVTVADYLDITGERTPTYADSKRGWTKPMIYAAKIVSDDGRNYRLILPDSIPIE